MEKGKVEYQNTVTDGINTSTMTIYENGNMVFTVDKKEESQLDRIEKKLDRLLNILENGELSSLEIGKLEDLPDGILEQFNIGREAKS